MRRWWYQSFATVEFLRVLGCSGYDLDQLLLERAHRCLEPPPFGPLRIRAVHVRPSDKGDGVISLFVEGDEVV